MVNEDFWKNIESVAGNLPKGNVKATFTYVTGEIEVFEFDVDVRYQFLASAKKRDKYFFNDNKLINMDHVVKVHFEDIDKQK